MVISLGWRAPKGPSMNRAKVPEEGPLSSHDVAAGRKGDRAALAPIVGAPMLWLAEGGRSRIAAANAFDDGWTRCPS
jgi:hypothetical protein